MTKEKKYGAISLFIVAASILIGASVYQKLEEVKYVKYDVVVKDISGKKMLIKDVKSGQDKIIDISNIYYDDGLQYITKNDNLKYFVPRDSAKYYEKQLVVTVGKLKLNYDSVRARKDADFARQQRELFNQTRQEMLRDTCR